MGNADSADSRGARGASALPTDSTAPLPSLAALDLSHLTDKERRQIETVLGRQYTIEMEEEDRIRALKKELAALEQSVANRRRVRAGIKACFVCGKALVRTENSDGEMPESSKLCRGCSNVCCVECGAPVAKNKESLWLCNMCAKKREFIMKSGLWHRRSSVGALYERVSPPMPQPYRSTSPNPPISITLTSPDLDNGHVLLDERSHDQHSPIPSSDSGSSEVGGFTPPHDVEALMSGGSSYGEDVDCKKESMVGEEKLAVEVVSESDVKTGEVTGKKRSFVRRRLPEVPTDAKPWTSPAAAAIHRERMRTTANGEELTEARVSELIEESSALYAVAKVPSSPPPATRREEEKTMRRESLTSVDEPGHAYARIGFKVVEMKDDDDDDDDVPDPGYEKVRVSVKETNENFGYERVDERKNLAGLYAKVDKKRSKKSRGGSDSGNNVSDVYAQVKKEKKKKKKDKEEGQDPAALYAKVDKSKKSKKAKTKAVDVKKSHNEATVSEKETSSKSDQQVHEQKRARQIRSKPHQQSSSTSIRGPKGIVAARAALFETLSSAVNPSALSKKKQDPPPLAVTPPPAEEEKEKTISEEAREPSVRSSSPSTLSSVTSFSSSVSSIPMRESPKPPQPQVTTKPNEEIVEVCLSRVEGQDNFFGLDLAMKPNGIQLYISRINRDDCPSIDIGDEVISVENEKDVNRIRKLMAQRSTVKMKIKRRIKKGFAFKEKLKEKQRKAASPEFSLASAICDSPRPESESHLETLVEEEDHEKKNGNVSCRDSGLEPELSSPLATSSPLVDGDSVFRPASNASGGSATVVKRREKAGKAKTFFQRFSSAFGSATKRESSMVELRTAKSIDHLDMQNTQVANKSTSLPRKLVGSDLALYGQEDDDLSSLSDSLSLNEDSFQPLEDANSVWHLGKGQMLKSNENGEALLSAGKIYLSLLYVNGTLTVEMIEARNLIGQKQPGVQIPYAKVYLLSSNSNGKERLAKQKTKPATRAADPAFYDRMHFKDVDLEGKYLKVMIWRRSGPAVFSKRRCVGHAFISLDGLEATTKITNWYELFVPCPATAQER